MGISTVHFVCAGHNKAMAPNADGGKCNWRPNIRRMGCSRKLVRRYEGGSSHLSSGHSWSAVCVGQRAALVWHMGHTYQLPKLRARLCKHAQTGHIAAVVQYVV